MTACGSAPDRRVHILPCQHNVHDMALISDGVLTSGLGRRDYLCSLPVSFRMSRLRVPSLAPSLSMVGAWSHMCPGAGASFFLQCYWQGLQPFLKDTGCWMGAPGVSGILRRLLPLPLSVPPVR